MEAVEENSLHVNAFWGLFKRSLLATRKMLQSNAQTEREMEIGEIVSKTLC